MSLTLIAEKRQIVGKQVSRLRAAGLMPVVLYGHDQEPINLQLRQLQFSNIYREAGASSLVDVELEGQKTPVLIHDAQFNPVNGAPLHADLFAVSMKEKLQTEIPLTFIGKSEAVDILEGTLVTNKDHLKVECLPMDLVHEIEVDLNKLVTLEDVIHVKDIVVGEKLTILDDPDEVVVLVHAPKTAEELEAELAEPIGEEAPVEVELSEERGLKDKEGETAEGEEATKQEEPAEEPKAKKND